MDALGSRIKALRLKANLSKAALARRVGVSDVTISYWESGTIKQIGHERLVALTEALDCSLSDLLEGTPAPPSSSGILHLRSRQPAPWIRQGAGLMPLLDGLPLRQVTADCHLVTPAYGESFDFLANGDLAAVYPLTTFLDDGLYILEHFDQLVVRRLEKRSDGQVRISDEYHEIETVPLSALPFRLLAQIRARWHLIQQ
ncbi:MULTISPECIES: helix-turn-helix domain-containing protein [Modicisalibacter]|uniref:helix-turn-helix domain-containing protein n=1 Tax=Modicisalibacter TaxID=574347 RepID=UPI001CCE016F|nr:MULTISPECIES: helix-turn-helix domain-containing protein [Halomonadaceae]